MQATVYWVYNAVFPLTSRIERKYCLVSTLYFAGLFFTNEDICDAYHKELNLISFQSWTYLSFSAAAEVLGTKHIERNEVTKVLSAAFPLFLTISLRIC